MNIPKDDLIALRDRALVLGQTLHDIEEGISGRTVFGEGTIALWYNACTSPQLREELCRVAAKHTKGWELIQELWKQHVGEEVTPELRSRLVAEATAIASYQALCFFDLVTGKD